MKTLSMNRLAYFGIRANRKHYRLLAASVFLAVFIAVGTVLTIGAMEEKAARQRQARYGQEDAFFFDADEVQPDTLVSQGLASKVGTITLTGSVRGFPIGYYDETAASLLCRHPLEGRMPEGAGEIAMDLTALEQLYPGKQIGDFLSLTPDGGREARQYRLVGILQAQFDDDTRLYFQRAVPAGSLGMPRILLSLQEGGAAVNRHLVLLFPFGGTLGALQEAYPQGALLGIGPQGEPYQADAAHAANGPRPDRVISSQIWMLRCAMLFGSLSGIPMSSQTLVVGCALLFGSLLGIFEAMTGQFDRKQQQYSLYRTIGATRRQLRAISRREALVLALLLSPAAVLCAVLVVWGACRLFPDSLIFSLNIPVILLSILVTFLLIRLAAGMPLLFTGTRTQRRRLSLPRRSTIRSRKNYCPEWLWNQRKLRFHPLRQIGCVLLVLCMNLALSSSADVLQDTIDRLYVHRDTFLPEKSEFRIIRTYFPLSSSFTLRQENHLTPADLEEIRALPHIQSVQGRWTEKVFVPVDRVGELFAYNQPDTDTPLNRQITDALGTDGTPLELNLCVVSDFSELESILPQGSVSKEEIDSGQKVILNLPQYVVSTRSDGSTSYSVRLPEDPMPIGNGVLLANDQFTVGQAITLCQLCVDRETYERNTQWEDNNALFASAEKRTAETTVGAILAADSMRFYTVFTTPEGLSSLGLCCDYTSEIEMETDGPTDAETDSLLQSALTRIAAREDDMDLSYYTGARFNAFAASTLRRTLFSLCVTLGLLLFSLMIVSGDVLRQIRADKRTIGILRALGSDAAMLQKHYTLQIWAVTGSGGLLLFLAMVSGIIHVISTRLPFYALCCILSTALISVVCGTLAKAELKKLLGQSVMETIRDA